MDSISETPKKTIKIVEEEILTHREGHITARKKDIERAQNVHIEYEVVREKLEEYLDEGREDVYIESVESDKNIKEYYAAPKHAQARDKPPRVSVFRDQSIEHMSFKGDKKLVFKPEVKGKKEDRIHRSDLCLPAHITCKMRSLQSQATSQMLITSSEYSGVWRDSIQCMDGYGVYTYPDGSEYRGYFSRGLFNGYGTLHLAQPYNFTYKGTFIDGALRKIEDMWFEDGLHVKATFANWKADFSNWKYGSEKDRRFALEQSGGLPAVGPFSLITNDRPPRALGKNAYDVAEGFFNPYSGLVMSRPKPFLNPHVPCPKEVDWIKKNCRHSSDIEPYSPGHVLRKIIENNLESELLLQEHEASCNYNQELLQKRYFGKLCKDDIREGFKKDSKESLAYDSSVSSLSPQSITEETISVDVQEFLDTEGRYQSLFTGRDLETEASTLVTLPFKRDSRHSSDVSFSTELENFRGR